MHLRSWVRRRLCDLVEACQRAFERVALVRDHELQESSLLDDLLSALGIVDAGQLHDDAVGAYPLYDRFRHTELVDAITNDLQRTVQGVRLVGDCPFRFIDFEGEVHTALQVESALQRDALNSVEDKNAIALYAFDDGAWPERPDGRDHERYDRQDSVLQVRHR
jgi:hypothetical protein